MLQKKKILILIDWFLPGIKAGGPIKSVSAIVNQLYKDFDFYILTTDTDFGETLPYNEIKSDTWIDFQGKAKVCYLSSAQQSAKEIEKQILLISADIIYINSFYSKLFSIIPLKIIKRHKLSAKIILAPRGMLAEGALRIKPFKKKVFIAYAKMIGLHTNLLWHSTKADETNDIKKIFGNVNVAEIQNLPDVELISPSIDRLKVQNELRLIYLGRVAENKNLTLVLKTLREIKVGKVMLDIYGSIEDENYWKQCLSLINELDDNVIVSYKGMLAAGQIQNIISNYHYLILLSYSENFGHAIVESFSCGTPVIIGNVTPWKNLEKANAGWDVEINSTKPVLNALQMALSLSNDEYQKKANAAYEYGKLNCFDNGIKIKYYLLF